MTSAPCSQNVFLLCAELDGDDTSAVFTEDESGGEEGGDGTSEDGQQLQQQQKKTVAQIMRDKKKTDTAYSAMVSHGWEVKDLFPMLAHLSGTICLKHSATLILPPLSKPP